MGLLGVDQMQNVRTAELSKTHSLTQAVTGRAPAESLIPALRREIQAMVQHCAADSAVPIWRMVDETPALRDYEESMRLRHTESLTMAITADLDLPPTTTACRTIARFVIDAYSLGRAADNPEAAVDEIFQMIEAAWAAADTALHGRLDGTVRSSRGMSSVSE